MPHSEPCSFRQHAAAALLPAKNFRAVQMLKPAQHVVKHMHGIRI